MDPQEKEMAFRPGHEPTRAILAAFLSNIGIAALKTLAAIITHSTAMIAEALHSFADTGNQVLVGLGIRLGRKPPDAGHPFGYGKDRYFWNFMIGIHLFILGGAFSIYEGIRKLRGPHELHHTLVNFMVLGCGMLLEGTSWVIALRNLQPTDRKPAALYRYILNEKSFSLAIIIIEDTAALIGLLFATVGLSLSAWTGNSRWDATASIAIGLLLMAVAALVTRESRSLLIGEGIQPADRRRILKAVLNLADVRAVYDFRSMYLGPQTLIIALEVDLVKTTPTTIDSVARTIDTIESTIRAQIPQAKYIYVEVERDPFSLNRPNPQTS